MRIYYTEPRIHVFSKQVFIGDPEFPIPPDGDDAVKIGAFAAKQCYASAGEDGRANCQNQQVIMESRHGRVLEHIVVGLRCTGISRALANELITHKVGNTVSQESTRYVDMQNGTIVLEPYMAALFLKYGDDVRWEEYEDGPVGKGYFDQNRWDYSDEDQREVDLLRDHLNHQLSSLEEYEAEVKALIDVNPFGKSGTALRKWARGKARNVLPLGLATTIAWTLNLRAARHFIEMRSERTAEPEIRRFACHLFTVLQAHYPHYFADYTVEMVDGLPEFTPTWRKV